MTCLEDDGSDKAGSHRQKLYQNTFSFFLHRAYNELGGVARQFVKKLCPGDLSVEALIVVANVVSKLLLVQREATIEIHVPKSKMRLMALSWKWFRDYFISLISASRNWFDGRCIATRMLSFF